MVVVTNGNDKILFEDNILIKENENFNGYYALPKNEYWGIELMFLTDNGKNYSKIIKRYPKGDSYKKEYINLTPTNENKIFLLKSDFNEVKRLWKNMNSRIDFRRNTIIEAGAILLSYDCYQNFILEEDDTPEIDEMFQFLVDRISECKFYKNEIYKKTIEILKYKYKITNLNELFKTVKEDNVGM